MRVIPLVISFFIRKYMMKEQAFWPYGITPQWKVHMIQAFCAACEEEGRAPYVVIHNTKRCRVPLRLSTQEIITFDISSEATGSFQVTEQAMTFQARFGEENRIESLYIPLSCVKALFPENRQSRLLVFRPILATRKRPSRVSESAEEEPVKEKNKKIVRLK